MRDVTAKIVGAWIGGKALKVGNTRTDGKNIYLHGNLIARRMTDGKVQVSNGGYGSLTTRERLNGIAAATLSNLRFAQKGGKQVVVYGEQTLQWDGGWIEL